MVRNEICCSQIEGLLGGNEGEDPSKGGTYPPSGVYGSFLLHSDTDSLANPPTPSAVEIVRTNSKSIFKHSCDPREPDPGPAAPYTNSLRHSGSSRVQTCLKEMKKEMLDFGT